MFQNHQADENPTEQKGRKMYNLVYSSIEAGGSWIREQGELLDLITLSENEQHLYDGCYIEDDSGRAIWEPSLGIIEDETAI